MLLGSWLAACASTPPPTPTELGLEALAAGDWRTAQSQFALALERDAMDAAAWHGQARAQLAGRDPEAALSSLARLARIDRDRFSGAARATYGDALAHATRRRIDEGQTQAALEAARALAALDARRSGLGQLLGEALIAEADRIRLHGKAGDALALYREATTVSPGRLAAWVGAAEILLEKRKGKAAMQLLEAARRAHPTAGAIRTLSLQALRLR